MTLLRKLALTLSNRIVEYAPPSRKDFAAGLAREVEFIASDWRALAWSLGSLRVLLTAAPGEGSRPPLWYLWPVAEALFILAYSASLYMASNWHDRLAAALLLFGWAGWLLSAIADLLENQNQPPISDLRAYQLYTRTKLERRLARYRSPRRWLPPLIPISLGTGYLMRLKGTGSGYLSTVLILVATAIATFALSLDTPAKIESRLLRLNQRIAKSEAARS